MDSRNLVTSGKNRASKERTSHPAQFPIAVIDRIIKASSHGGDLIIDPFLGSGTTAIAALSLNRQVIGFEIKPEYCEIATQRIQNHLEEMNLIQTSLLISLNPLKPLFKL
ncbi:MAG: hypothetical protein AUK43_11305 [Oscillatoriales cyanobacterium CG2_30_40_61]|nr:MAG: hypothetical protein AUK43_11305 [Oscillatoriales cyanobacterium CG2_30_40_61]